MKNFKLTKKAVVLASSFVITSACAVLVHKESKVNILSMNENVFVAEYDDGLIVMGSQDYLDMISDEHTIKILDERKDENHEPNVKIYNSYKVLNPLLISNILDALIEYEEAYPTNWDRTKKSMYNEWLIHNLGYYLDYKVDHNIDVDIDNPDEDLFIHPKVLRILKEKNY